MDFFQLADRIAEVGYPDKDGNRVFGEEAILLCIHARRIRYEDFCFSKESNDEMSCRHRPSSIKKPSLDWLKEAARYVHSYE